jgi:hypothetical protein
LKILQNTYVIVVKGCVLHIKFLMCYNHVLKNFQMLLKMWNLMIMCWFVIVAKREFIYLNFMLWDYIVIDKSNMEFFLMLNKVEKHLIARWLAFAQNFQLHGYGQYGIHGSIVNVPTNLNLIQNVLPQMPYDDSSKKEIQKKVRIYKSIYVFGYVHPNIVMKALQ